MDIESAKTDDLTILTLTSGPMTCRVAPELGGAIVELSCNGVAAFRSAEGLTDVRQTACFPLVPFANRIAWGRFRFGDRALLLSIDPEGAPHALHGHGWRDSWKFIQPRDDQLTLILDHAEDDWPWPYQAQQRLELTPGGLLIELQVENRHPTLPMPVGLGLHPYFPRTPGSSIVTTATHMWENDPDGLSSTLERSALFAGQPIAIADLTGLDNFFPSRNPHLVISDQFKIVTIRADGIGFHVYCPRGQTFFCIEPASHAPNSFGRGEIGDDDVLAPFEAVRQRYYFDVQLVPDPSRSSASRICDPDR